MDLQKIEPVLMDYALGATTPEVAALVEAYQEKDVGARSRLEEWREVTNLAQRVMGEQAPRDAPVFPRQRFESARRAKISRRMAVWAVALAACLMIGFAAGRSGVERMEFAVPSSVAVNAPAAVVDDFWAQSRIRAVAEQQATRGNRSPASSASLMRFLQRLGG